MHTKNLLYQEDKCPLRYQAQLNGEPPYVNYKRQKEQIINERDSKREVEIIVDENELRKVINDALADILKSL